MEWDKIPKRLYEDLYTTHRVINKAQRIVQSENGYYHYLVREDNISNSFNPIKGRDIFYGFVSRYEFLENIDVGIDVYSIVFEKMSINGIQDDTSIMSNWRNRRNKQSGRLCVDRNEKKLSESEKQ